MGVLNARLHRVQHPLNQIFRELCELCIAFLAFGPASFDLLVVFGVLITVVRAFVDFVVE